MRHNVQKLKLGLPRGQRVNMIGNLATSLILHEKIQTTQAKAKALQPYIDKLVNLGKLGAKKNTIREIGMVLQNDLSAKKLIEDIGKRYPDRVSGYTRITNVGFRQGDAAPVVQIELLEKS
jgi:large subunit ribosomal protein L17